MRHRGVVDKPLALLIATLVVGGAMVFASAAFGILARGNVSIASVFFGHVVLGIGGGLALPLIGALIDYRHWRPLAPYLFVLAIVATAAVFIPHLGASHGGGRRWIVLLGVSLQPSEGLKIATIVMAAAYFATIRNRVETISWGAGGFVAILALPTLILVLEPDIGTLSVICASVAAIFFVAGARLRDIGLLLIVGIIAIGVLAVERPYVRDRVMTFFYPAQGQLAEGYQIKQSLIAIGSGGLTGRGFGQSVQKFTYLPEPMGDSIFAVAAEELGFIGALAIVVLFLFLALRGYVIAAHTHDPFGGLLAVGIATYLVSEAFVNIAAMLGLVPLTGIPLTFVSQGGSAILISLASAGILLNISRHAHRS